MPIIGIIVGKPSFSDLTLKIGDGVILYGAFLTEVVNFLIIAFVLFLMIKMYNKMVSLKGPKVEEAAEADELQLLTEIRDALRARP
jgi:large conductance mechanosensitive channel